MSELLPLHYLPGCQAIPFRLVASQVSLGQIGSKWDTSRTLKDQFVVYFGPASQNILEIYLKKSEFFIFWPSLTLFEATSDKPLQLTPSVPDPPENCHLTVKKLPKT